METTALSPQDAGLSLVVVSGPTGMVKPGHISKEDWPCIHYKIKVMKGDRLVIETDYHLGVGHAKLPSRLKQYKYSRRLSAWQLRILESWIAKPHSTFNSHKQDWADVAAAAAKVNKLSPSLDDVMHSLLIDGTAHFDSLSFEDWAFDYGYDSIKAKATYEQCCDAGRAIGRALSRQEIDALREWASNYYPLTGPG